MDQDEDVKINLTFWLVYLAMRAFLAIIGVGFLYAADYLFPVFVDEPGTGQLCGQFCIFGILLLILFFPEAASGFIEGIEEDDEAS
tara:strand:- start:562 stop:819 length:258 start_codon:yes stop_codon:yes gene_type:complete